MYQKVVLPLDGSELAEAALSYVKGIASRLGLEVTLLHVAAKGESESLPLHRAYIDQQSERLRKEMAEVQAKSGGQPVVVKGEVVIGYPADEMTTSAEMVSPSSSTIPVTRPPSHSRLLTPDPIRNSPPHSR